ncbi:MAG: NUDIX hydrolase [Gammaproteobacteria bacterium]|jgi:ADP-ribose pyrophosphatase YjhB (NUDIX family)
MIWKPHVTVAAVVETAGRFLLVQERVAGKPVYNQPAGHLEDGESLVKAVVRETLEETAWHFHPEAVTGIYRWRQPDRQKTFLRVTFTGRALYHDPQIRLDPCIERTLWLSSAQVRARTEQLRSPLVLRSIDDYLAGHAWPLSLLADIDQESVGFS